MYCKSRGKKEVDEKQTIVVGDRWLKPSAEIGQLGAMKVGRLGQSLLVFTVQFSHQWQLSIQLVHLKRHSAGFKRHSAYLKSEAPSLVQ